MSKVVFISFGNAGMPLPALVMMTNDHRDANQHWRNYVKGCFVFIATMATMMMFLIIIANLYPEQCSVNKVTKCQIKVSRMHTGPEIGGCKPVVVTFEDFKDREDVLR